MTPTERRKHERSLECIRGRCNGWKCGASADAQIWAMRSELAVGDSALAAKMQAASDALVAVVCYLQSKGERT